MYHSNVRNILNVATSKTNNRLESLKPREHEGTERDTEGVGCDMS